MFSEKSIIRIEIKKAKVRIYSFHKYYKQYLFYDATTFQNITSKTLRLIKANQSVHLELSCDDKNNT